jgi:hypothetical protein
MVHGMRAAFAFAFILLMLKPLAGAAVCLEREMTRDDCAMAEEGFPAAPASDELPHGCALLDACAAPAPSTVPVSVEIPVLAAAHPFSSGILTLIHSVDPTAPPAPPPNS